MRPVLETVNSTYREVTKILANNTLDWNTWRNISSANSSVNVYWLTRVLLCEQHPEAQTSSDQEPYIEQMVKNQQSPLSNDSSTEGSARDDSYVYDNSTSMYFFCLRGALFSVIIFLI